MSLLEQLHLYSNQIGSKGAQAGEDGTSQLSLVFCIVLYKVQFCLAKISRPSGYRGF